MEIGRILPGVVALDGIVFVVGGEQDSQILANGEKYDPLENKWSEVIIVNFYEKNNLVIIIKLQNSLAKKKKVNMCINSNLCNGLMFRWPAWWCLVVNLGYVHWMVSYMPLEAGLVKILVVVLKDMTQIQTLGA